MGGAWPEDNVNLARMRQNSHMFIAHLMIAGGREEGPIRGPQAEIHSKETPLEGVAWKKGNLQSQENQKEGRSEEGRSEEVRVV
jgi:hypothetical protein